MRTVIVLATFVLALGIALPDRAEAHFRDVAEIMGDHNHGTEHGHTRFIRLVCDQYRHLWEEHAVQDDIYWHDVGGAETWYEHRDTLTEPKIIYIDTGGNCTLGPAKSPVRPPVV